MRIVTLGCVLTALVLAMPAAAQQKGDTKEWRPDPLTAKVQEKPFTPDPLTAQPTLNLDTIRSGGMTSSGMSGSVFGGADPILLATPGTNAKTGTLTLAPPGGPRAVPEPHPLAFMLALFALAGASRMVTRLRQVPT